MKRAWCLLVVAAATALAGCGTAPVVTTARHGDEDALVLMVARTPGPGIRIADRYGMTPLHYAVERGFTRGVQALLRAGADVEARTDHDETPLFMAARAGLTEIAYELLVAGAQVDAPSGIDHARPMHAAAQFDHIGMVALLLRWKADVDGLNGFGQTPLHIAAANGWREDTTLAEMLLARGADMHRLDNRGFDPLLTAVFFNNSKVLELLEARGADPDARTTRGTSALDLALERNADAIAQSLFQRGLRPARMAGAVPPLHVAARMDDDDLARFLLSIGNDAQLRYDGVTALDVARASGSRDVTDALEHHLEAVSRLR